MHLAQFIKWHKWKTIVLFECVRIVGLLEIAALFLLCICLCFFFTFIYLSYARVVVIMENVNRSLLLLTKVVPSVSDRCMYEFNIRTQTRTAKTLKVLSFSLQIASVCFTIIFFSFCFSKRSNYLQMNVQNSTTKNNNICFLAVIPRGHFFTCTYFVWMHLYQYIYE